ncbi:hypothetical protein Tco_1276129 [Tanacetum coccineum]
MVTKKTFDEEFKNFTVQEIITVLKYHTIAGHTSPMRFHSVLPSLLSQSGRIVLATSAPKSDNNEQVVIGNRSSFKSCGPVASMSRQDWAKKLVHRKTEFVDTLKLGVDNIKAAARKGFLLNMGCCYACLWVLDYTLVYGMDIGYVNVAVISLLGFCRNTDLMYHGFRIKI